MAGRSNQPSYWPLRLLCVLFGLAGLSSSGAAAAPSEVPHENYRVLDWQDLVPEGWEPPVIAAAFDEVSERGVDQSSVVKALDGQLVALPGYMKPVVFAGNQVSEFLLVPFLPQQTRSHAHLEPNQMVYVFALEPVLVEQPFEPIWIVGALSLEPVLTDEGPAAYRMVEAVTTPYEY